MMMHIDTLRFARLVLGGMPDLASKCNALHIMHNVNGKST